MLDLCSADNFTVGQSAAVQIWTFLQFGLMQGLAIFEEKMRLLWTQFLLTCSWPLIISTSNFQTFLIIEKNFSNQQNHSGDTVWKPWLQSIKKKTNLYSKQNNICSWSHYWLSIKLNHLKLPFIEIKQSGWLSVIYMVNLIKDHLWLVPCELHPCYS